MKGSLLGGDNELLSALDLEPKKITEEESPVKELLTGGGADSARTEKFDYQT